MSQLALLFNLIAAAQVQNRILPDLLYLALIGFCALRLFALFLHLDTDLRLRRTFRLKCK